MNDVLDPNEAKKDAGTAEAVVMGGKAVPKTTVISTESKLGYQKPRRRARAGQSLFQSVKSALQAILANKLRSLLTSLGIIIGVGAVIMVVSISESNAAAINQRLSSLNPNELTIRSGSTSTGGIRGGQGTAQTLTSADANAISQLPHLTAVSPIASVSGGQVIFQDQNWSSTVQGVYPSYLQLGGWQMQAGAFFTQSDLQSSTAVAVVGQSVITNLFAPAGVTNPIGQQIRIRNVPFTVVGTLQSKGSTSSSFSDPDDVIYIPFTTAQQRLTGSQYASSISVLVDDQSNLDSAENAIEQALEQTHNISNPANDDFTIQSQAQILQTAQSIMQALTTLLVSVAAISLLVGGIGIMNIMLVSVTERTREIGIRMAIGARASDVMTQFLIEALVLSALGGLVGIILGSIGAFIISLVSGNQFALSPMAVFLAFGFSAAVGVLFGFYPAQRAARLDPIVALRTQ
jgi:putative ABC transport system permease protein